jgi:hypothetical protein
MRESDRTGLAVASGHSWAREKPMVDMKRREFISLLGGAAGGNATGFTQFEYSLSGKWLELLREVAPQVRRVGVIRDPLATGPVGDTCYACLSTSRTAAPASISETGHTTFMSINRGRADERLLSGSQYRKDDIIRVAQQLLRRRGRQSTG